MQRTELHDWSAYLLEAEYHLKQISHKLLHGQYDTLDKHVQSVKSNLDKTIDWAQEHTRLGK